MIFHLFTTTLLFRDILLIYSPLFKDLLKTGLLPGKILHIHPEAFDNILDIGSLVVLGVTGHPSYQLSRGFLRQLI